MTQETPPAGRFNDAEVQCALRDSKALMKTLAKRLKDGEAHIDKSSSLGKLVRDTRALADFEIGVTRTVGVVGDTGVGMFRHRSMYQREAHQC